MFIQHAQYYGTCTDSVIVMHMYLLAPATCWLIRHRCSIICMIQTLLTDGRSEFLDCFGLKGICQAEAPAVVYVSTVTVTLK